MPLNSHVPPSLSFSEIEAKEACDWLRAAGFPQYAQLYEGRSAFHSLFTTRADRKRAACVLCCCDLQVFVLCSLLASAFAMPTVYADADLEINTAFQARSAFCPASHGALCLVPSAVASLSLSRLCVFFPGFCHRHPLPVPPSSFSSFFFTTLTSLESTINRLLMNFQESIK